MSSVVAIEVSRDAIRAAEIGSPFSKHPKILKIGEIEIPVDVAGESVLNDEGVFIEYLKQLWEEEGFKTRNVVLVVSGRRFIVRDHETAHKSMKDLQGVLEFETASIVPEHLKNPIIEFYPTHHTDRGKTAGLVIATPAEPIENIVTALAKAKMNVDYVDFAPMAVARFIRNYVKPEDYGEGYALANIRESSTDIVVTKGDTPRLIRVAPLGLSPKKRKIGRHAAEIDIRLDEEQNIAEKTPMDSLARQIRVTVSSQVDSLGIAINKLYISGPRSDEKTVERLQELLEMEVVALNANNVSQKDGLDEELSSSEFVAICAGMRGGKK